MEARPQHRCVSVTQLRVDEATPRPPYLVPHNRQGPTHNQRSQSPRLTALSRPRHSGAVLVAGLTNLSDGVPRGPLARSVTRR